MTDQYDRVAARVRPLEGVADPGEDALPPLGVADKCPGITAGELQHKIQ